MDEKKDMRARVLARRDAIPAAERAAKSARICERLEQVVEDALAKRSREAATAGGRSADAGRAKAGFHASLLVAAYSAMRSEVDVQPFVEAAEARGWDVCFPCMVRDTPEEASRMAFYQVPFERLAEARAAFLDKPLRCLPCTTLADDGFRALDPCEIDVVLVPLVAFDGTGNRLGYGGGNYDRLLPLLRPDALVIGVAFEEQREPALPCEPHDRRLPHIVSA